MEPVNRSELVESRNLLLKIYVAAKNTQVEYTDNEGEFFSALRKMDQAVAAYEKWRDK
jgi:hypothetical protein